MMSGWPQGAVDSLCCSADVLTGSGPLASLLSLSLCSLQSIQRWGVAGETAEVERGVKLEETRKLRKIVEKQSLGEKDERER